MKSVAHSLFTLAAITGCYAYIAIPSSQKFKTIGKRKTSTCIYSVPYLPTMEDEGDDGSFFLSASQQAAKDRYEMVKQGKDPLAIALSTTLVKEEPHQQQRQDILTEEKDASESSDSNTDAASSLSLEKDDYNDLLTSLSDSPMAQSLKEQLDTNKDVEESSPSTLDEIKRVEDEIAAVRSQKNYRFQKKLMDARMALNNVERVGEGSTAEEMEEARNARLAAADEMTKILKSDKEVEEDVGASAPSITETIATADAGEGSTAEEMEEARKSRLAAADEIAQTLTTNSASVVTVPSKEKEETKVESEIEASPPANNSEEESSNASQSKLSSDGKAVYEPSEALLSIKQENVDNGLMVLTRSFLVLNSIVDRLTEEKD